MADQKISQLSDGGASQATDEYVIARSGSNFRIDGASIAAAATSIGTLTSLTVTGTATVGTVAGTTITEGGSAIVRQTDIGSAPNEIPLNQYLGTMAYQDAAAVLADTLTVNGTLTVDTNTLAVDATNNRVGIGTTTPGQALEVTGRQRFSGSSVGIVVENRMTAVSVTTSAVTILDDGGAYGRLVVVNGGSGSDRFCDLVLASTSVSPTVVSSFTAGGSPAARTYTRSGSALQLAMASGTYSVWALALGY